MIGYECDYCYDSMTEEEWEKGGGFCRSSCYAMYQVREEDLKRQDRTDKAELLREARKLARKDKAEGMAKGDEEALYWIGGKQFVAYVKDCFAELCEDPYAEHNSNYIADIMSGLRRY